MLRDVDAAERYDRHQAFAAGFAMAAKDAGLSDDEFVAMCKIAADAIQVESLSRSAKQEADRQNFVRSKLPQQPAQQQKQAEEAASRHLAENMAARQASIAERAERDRLARMRAERVAQTSVTNAATRRLTDVANAGRKRL
jgi:hypothetical protein